jgi:hypothetical protein
MVRTRQDFSLYLSHESYNSQVKKIENPLKNPKRNFVMIFVVFFVFLGSGAIYSLIINRLSIFEDRYLYRSYGTIISGIVIFLMIKYGKRYKNNGMIIYAIIASIVSLILYNFNYAIGLLYILEVTGYYTILAFLILYIVETNIPRRQPLYNVYIWCWALIGDYFSVSGTNFLVNNDNIYLPR